MPRSRFQDVYYKLPVRLQNGIFSLYGLKLASTRLNAPFFALGRSLEESEWWSRDQIRALAKEGEGPP